VAKVHDKNEAKHAGENKQGRGQDFAFRRNKRVGYHGCRCYVRVSQQTREKVDE